MQHPDEGTIHSWLDGALSQEEAANMESHVAACPSCAAAVAEARGFVAASSRILTALDDIPRGVIPAVRERKRDLRVFWRAAAAMLVVAGGSLVVMREGGQEVRVSKTPSETAVLVAPPPNQPEDASATTGGTAQIEAGGIARVQAPIAQADERATTQSAKSAPVTERDFSAPTESRRRQSAANIAEPTVGTDALMMKAPQVMPSSAPPPPPASEPVALRVLAVERAIGLRRTTYEIGPSQTVELKEYTPLQLEAVVVGGAGSTVQRRAPTSGTRAAEPMRVEGAQTAPPPPPLMRDSRSAAESTNTANRAAAVAKTSVGQVQSGAAFVTAANTISWKDAATGNTLTLSGRVTVERLQEVRRQIEREREAARKTP